MWYSKKRKDPEEILALHVWPRITSTIHESVSWDCTVSTEQMFLFKRIGERSHFSRAPTQTKSSFELRVHDHAQTESQSSETIQDKGRSDFLRWIPSLDPKHTQYKYANLKEDQTLPDFRIQKWKKMSTAVIIYSMLCVLILFLYYFEKCLMWNVKNKIKTFNCSLDKFN